MVANTNPIFGRTPDVQLHGPALGATAVTALDGTGNLQMIFEADANEGSFVDNIVIKPVSTCAATCLNIFICEATGAFTPGVTNTASNTNLLTQITLPATSASNSTAMGEWLAVIRRALQPGFKILVGFGTSTGAAGTGYVFTTFGSKY